MTPVGRFIAAVAARWGVTEGQVYTAIIGVVVAVAAAIGGIAPALATHHVEPAPAHSVGIRPTAPGQQTSLR